MPQVTAIFTNLATVDSVLYNHLIYIIISFIHSSIISLFHEMYLSFLCGNHYISMSPIVLLNGDEACHPHHALMKNVMPLFFLKIPCLFLLFCGSYEMFDNVN